MRANSAARGRGTGAALLGMVLVSGIALASCSIWGAKAVSAPRYALVYGVSLYDTGNEGIFPNLTYADNDAIAMAQTLSERGWDDVRTRYRGASGITADLPTKAQLLDVDLPSLSDIEPDSVVLVYFSGHGTYSGDTEYFIPYQGIDASHKPVLGNCVSPDELSAALASLPTKNVMVILDTCYSGGFVNAGSSIDTAPQDYGVLDDGVAQSTIAAALSNFGALLVANATEKGATPPIVISAAGSDEVSYESASLGHGLFTSYLIASASNGNSDGDGFVTAIEAYTYTKNRLADEWNNDVWSDSSYYYNTGQYADYLPRISGGARDLVLFLLY